MQENRESVNKYFDNKNIVKIYTICFRIPTINIFEEKNGASGSYHAGFFITVNVHCSQSKVSHFYTNNHL